MNLEIMYGETSKKDKVISVHLRNKNNSICALINAGPIVKARKRDRDKFLYELQQAINACVEAVNNR